MAGVPLNEYVRSKEFTMRARLQLFCKISEAINYVHQHAVIHRDLKPSNILIDADGNPKVLDFGLAKITESDIAATTVVTEIGKIQGTLPYMSPEQARGKPDAIDLRSDVYSLGVILYELLTEQLPYDVSKAMLHEAVRVICEEEPRKPSTISKRLRGDVETIALKALEKEPSRRYQSAAALAEDVERYLTNQPILARPSSALYQFRKLIVRHKVPFALAALLFIVVTGFALVATFQATRLAKERNKALVAQKHEAEARKAAEQQSDELHRRDYFNKIALAQNAYQGNNLVYMKSLLEQCPSDLRGWEWYWLRRISDRSTLTFSGTSGLGAEVTDVAFSPDGRRIASCSNNGTIMRIWETATGKEVVTLQGRGDRVEFSATGSKLISRLPRGRLGGVWDVESGKDLSGFADSPIRIRLAAVSPDGNRIVAAEPNQVPLVWDTTTGRQVMTLRGQDPGVGVAAFSPDGSRLVVGRGWTVKVWDVSAGGEPRNLSSGSGVVQHVAFSPDGERIAVGFGGRDATIEIIDVTSGETLLTLPHPRGTSRTVRFVPDGETIVSYDTKTFTIWDATTGAERVRFEGKTSHPVAFGLSPNGAHVVRGSLDGVITVWNIDTGKEALRIQGHAGMVRTVAFSPDAERMASVGDDKFVKIWDLGTGEELAALRGHNYPIWSVAFHPDGSRIASGDVDGTVRIWNLDSSGETFALRGEDDGLLAVFLSTDGEKLLSYGNKGTNLWDAATGERLLSLPLGGSFNVPLALSPDGTRIASASTMIKIWDTATGDELLTFHGHDEGVASLTFNADGSCIVTASMEISVWDSLTGEELLSVSGSNETPFWKVAFSQDGKRIAAGDMEGMVRVWNANTGELILGAQVHQDMVASVAFSPTGHQIMSSGGDIKVWDSATGDQMLNLRGHEGPVFSAAWSPDGKRIVSGGMDKTIKVWDSAMGHELLTLRGHEDWVTSVLFSAEGDRIVSASADGTVRIWETKSPPPEILERRKTFSVAYRDSRTEN